MNTLPLCCLLKPEWECIGCRIVRCQLHTDVKKKCPYPYKRRWSLDKGGHAWGMIKSMPGYREAEAEESDI